MQPLVLCVDDNRDVADSTALLLNLTGVPALACYNGAAAIALAEAEHPYAFLIDLNMPGMEGDELAARLRALPQGESIRLVALTAASDSRAMGRIVNAGFDGYLVKPANLADLLKAVSGSVAVGSDLE